MKNGGERRSLPLCALSSGAVHGLCVVVLLPMIMLSGPRAKVETIAIEVELVTALAPSASSPASDGDAVPAQTETSSESTAAAASTDLAILADETDRTSALPESAQESEPAALDPSEPVEGGAAVSEPVMTAPESSPSVANVEQPEASRSESAEIEIRDSDADPPAKPAKPEETRDDEPVSDTARPEADRSEAEAKGASTEEPVSEDPPQAEASPAAKAEPKKAEPKKATVAKPKPPARRTSKVQRKVVRTPGTATTGLQNLLKSLSKGRLNSKPVQARSRSGTGNKSAPASKGNKANPLYFR